MRISQVQAAPARPPYSYESIIWPFDPPVQAKTSCKDVSTGGMMSSTAPLGVKNPSHTTNVSKASKRASRDASKDKENERPSMMPPAKHEVPVHAPAPRARPGIIDLVHLRTTQRLLETAAEKAHQPERRPTIPATGHRPPPPPLHPPRNPPPPPSIWASRTEKPRPNLKISTWRSIVPASEGAPSRSKKEKSLATKPRR